MLPLGLQTASAGAAKPNGDGVCLPHHVQNGEDSSGATGFVGPSGNAGVGDGGL